LIDLVALPFRPPFLVALEEDAGFFAFVVVFFLVPLVFDFFVLEDEAFAFFVFEDVFVFGFVFFAVVFFVPLFFVEEDFGFFFGFLAVLAFLAAAGLVFFFSFGSFLVEAALALGLSLNDCFVWTKVPESTPLRIAVRSAL